jgi:hypothetical protein
VLPSKRQGDKTCWFKNGDKKFSRDGFGYKLLDGLSRERKGKRAGKGRREWIKGTLTFFIISVYLDRKCYVAI